MAEARESKTGLAHVVAYGEGAEWSRSCGCADDYVSWASSADAWEMTGEMKYYIAAESIVESARERF